MGLYSIKQRVSILNLYYQNNASVRKTYRALRTLFGKKERPTEQTICNLVKKFEASGSVLDIKPAVRLRSGRSVRNIEAVKKSVEEDPTLSKRQRAKLLGISVTTLTGILTEDLGLRSTAIENHKTHESIVIRESETSN